MTFEEWFTEEYKPEQTNSFEMRIAKAAWQASREAAIDECAAKCLKERDMFLSEKYAVNQPSSSYAERFACGILHDAILQLKDK